MSPRIYNEDLSISEVHSAVERPRAPIIGRSFPETVALMPSLYGRGEVGDAVEKVVAIGLR